MQRKIHQQWIAPTTTTTVKSIKKEDLYKKLQNYLIIGKLWHRRISVSDYSLSHVDEVEYEF